MVSNFASVFQSWIPIQPPQDPPGEAISSQVITVGKAQRRWTSNGFPSQGWIKIIYSTMIYDTLILNYRSLYNIIYYNI